MGSVGGGPRPNTKGNTSAGEMLVLWTGAHEAFQPETVTIIIIIVYK